jgi:hypothetical protein
MTDMHVRTWLLCLLFSLVPVVAYAQPAAEDEVRALFRQANIAFNEGRYTDAEKLYREAYDKRPAPDVAMNLGATLLKLERHREAAELLRRALDNFPAKFRPEELEKARAHYAEAQQHVGTYELTINVPATVSVDGRERGATTEPGATLFVFLDPGPHRLAVSAVGREPHGEELKAIAGASTKRSIDLEPVATHEEDPDAGGVPLPVPIILGAVGVAGIVVGVVGEVLRGGARDDYDAIRGRLGDSDQACAAAATTDCDALGAAIDDHDGYRSMEIAGFLIGGAALAAAGVTLIFADFGDEPAEVSIQPTFSPGAGGLTVRATW